MYDKVGNSPEAWASAADSLLAAVKLLRAARDVARANPPTVGNLVPDGERAQPSEIMLRGFALECLFKALWVKRGNLLAAQGKFLRIPHVGNHNLLQLAQKLAFNCAPTEVDLLNRLAIFTTSVGRYPIATDWSKTRIQESFDGGQGPPTYWVSPRDENDYTAIVMRLEAELGMCGLDAQQVAPADAEEQRG